MTGPLDRSELLGRIRTREPWDIVVIGGGATGLGTAVDASARGYRALLIEAHDFAKGTSSRSTKLIHGGVRYLAQGRIGLVREALHERGVLRANAPGLVQDRDFLVPSYRWWATPYYRIGLGLYDLLAGRQRLGHARAVGREEALRRVPTLRRAGLRGGVVYRDSQFDDARLAIALMRTVLRLGGTALNYLAATGLSRSAGRLDGLRARDAETGEEFAIAARAVVNAAGVFADEVRRLDDPDATDRLAPSQGAHVVLDRSYLPGETAVLVPRTSDGRVLFAIPWHGRVLVGTTDTPVARTSIEPRPTASEVAYLLEHAARYLELAPRLEDVRSVFAGLRPLIGPKSGPTASLSREHAVFVSGSGLVTITGGKWTTYRRMGADAVDQAARVAGLPRRPCGTEHLIIQGWASRDAPENLPGFGPDSEAFRTLLASRDAWSRPLHPALPYLAGEVVWAARHEAARTVEDVLARRTRALILDARASIEAAPRVADLLADELGRDGPWRAAQVRSFRELAAGYLPEG